MAASNGCGNGAAVTQPRISLPAAVRAGTSSTSSVASRSWMRWCKWLWAMKSRNAAAVVAKPPGTDTPRPARWPIISPREEFLPPTRARSARRSSCSHRMLRSERDAPGSHRPEGRQPCPRCGAAMMLCARAAPQAGKPREFRSSTGSAYMAQVRPVFYVSDGTGITAETIGHSLLTQFSGFSFLTDRIAFVDDPDKARAAAARIRAAGEQYGVQPIVVNSCVDARLSTILGDSGALMLDVFAPFIGPLEHALGQPRQAHVGRAHGMVDFDAYHRRIEAMNYTLAHDDGVGLDYAEADVVLVGVSRAGKT